MSDTKENDIIELKYLDSVRYIAAIDPPTPQEKENASLKSSFELEKLRESQESQTELERNVATQIGKEMPKRFDVIRANRWYVLVPGIDPYLIKRVVLPKLEIATPSPGYALSKWSNMIVSFYQSADRSTFEVARNLVLDPKEATIILRFVDMTGTIVEERTYHAWPASYSEEELDYNTSTPLVGSISFVVRSAEVTSHV